MRITSWNILHGQPLAQPTSTFATALTSLGSDLIACQEVDHHLDRSERCNQSRDIANSISAPYWGFAPAIAGTPGVSWRKLKGSEKLVISNKDHDEITSEEGFYGISIASKAPVKNWLRLELGRSLIGLPLAVANSAGKPRLLYVKDEPRVALAAVLENGWTAINTHLSFVPLVNIYQLLRLSRWAKKIEVEHSTKVLLVGDFNLPWGLPTKVTRWVRATNALSYPSWKPAISFDYILTRKENLGQLTEFLHGPIEFSDHRAISVDIP
jgi:endonuclease/exonuclease/phosphatase family metal-dependent hydrolase